jgi:hypothetical protein
MPYAGENATASVMQIGIPMGSTPTSTSSNGTATSGTTETFDAVLGYYQASLISGHQYEIQVNGLIGNGSVVADLYTVQIRDSQSGSNPTSASTQIAQSEWYVPAAGSSGRNSIAVSMAFVCTLTGVHVFGVSATRVIGTGVLTPIGARQLFIVDLGGN